MQLRRIEVGDEPGAWEAAGFTLSAGTDGTAVVVLGSTEIAPTGRGGEGLGWWIEGVHDGDGPGPATVIDGLAAASPPGVQPDGATHPNGIRSIDHVVVSTGDCERTTAVLAGLGIEARGGRSTTSYGSPMRQVFFWLGDVILELVGPDEGEPTTDRPAEIFGLALVAPDLDATGEALGELMGTPKEAVQEGRRIAGLRGAQVGIAVPLAVMSPHPRTGS